MIRFINRLNFLFLCFVVLSVGVFAQTNEFTYQGKLSDSGATSATYDFEFRLCDAEDDCAAPLETKQRLAVPVAGGAFSVKLDFDAAYFDGSDRWLEIAVKRPDQKDFTTLDVRQKITSAPYSIKSKSAVEATNAAQLGGVDASEYVTSSTVGNSFIKNDVTQQTANFNVSGNGFINGNVGIGTTTTQSKLTIKTGTFDPYGLTHTNGTVTVGTYVNSIGGWFGTRSNNPLYFFTNDSSPQMTILQSGSVGIGTTTPAAGIKLDVNGGVLFRTGSTFGGGIIGFGSPNSETGMTITGSGTTRADLRFDGSTLKLIATGAGIPPPTNGLAITTAGNVGIGTANPSSKLEVVGTMKTGTLQITGGSDLAENFEITGGAKAGMVVAIDPDKTGKLVVARGAYNRRVAGIVSGANDLSVGMILPDLKGTENSLPVALSGRVWVYCDATGNPIRAGDLLTTSATPGYAMKVVNRSKAQGAIIGKAMTDLKSGKGLVLVLVTLQ